MVWTSLRESPLVSKRMCVSSSWIWKGSGGFSSFLATVVFSVGDGASEGFAAGSCASAAAQRRRAKKENLDRIGNGELTLEV